MVNTCLDRRRSGKSVNYQQHKHGFNTFHTVRGDFAALELGQDKV